MSQPLFIDSLTAVPGIFAQGEGILLKVALSDGRAAWGACADLPPSYTVQTAIQAVTTIAAPALQNQPLSRFRVLAALVNRLTETVTVTYSVPPEPEPPGYSRRRLLTGLAPPPEPGPRLEQAAETRPFLPPLRFALSQVLLAAVALTQGKTPLAVLREEYERPAPETAVPFHLTVTETAVQIAHPILTTQVASFGYSTHADKHKTVLGGNAERLQQHVRQVKGWLDELGMGEETAVYLDIQGGFTTLYENDPGKMLGALYGLEQAAKPYQLRVANIITGPDAAETLQTLRSYLSMRGMRVEMAAAAGFYTPPDLRTLVETEAVHLVHLDVAAVGGVDESIHFLLTCREKGLKLLISGEGEAAHTAVHLALAFNADLLGGPPPILHNETIRLLSSAQQD